MSVSEQELQLPTGVRGSTVTEWIEKSKSGVLPMDQRPLGLCTAPNPFQGKNRNGTSRLGMSRIMDYHSVGENTRFEALSASRGLLEVELRSLQDDYAKPQGERLAEQLALYGTLGYIAGELQKLLKIGKARMAQHQVEIQASQIEQAPVPIAAGAL